jgi:outer membrane protein
MKTWKLLVAAAAMFSITGIATAQDLPVAEGGGMKRAVGAFGLVLPDYEGSDDYTGAPAPFLRWQFGEQRYVQVFGNSAFVNVLNHPNIELGPKAVYRRGRDDPDDSVVDLMQDVDDSFELGGYIGYRYNIQGNPRRRINLRFDITQDVTDGHDGYVADVIGMYWMPAGQSFDIGFRANATYASDDYMSTFFGVTPADSARSGLAVYDADAGFKDVGLATMGFYHVNKNWHVGGILLYKRLLGDAEDSPVVSGRGDENQFFAGLGLVYSW